MDTAPNQPRFTPRREPGVQLPAMANYSPVDLFKLFFTTQVVESLVANTNKYAESHDKSFRWQPLTGRKFYAFLAIVIFMGMVRVPSVQDYWEQDMFGQRFVKSTMSRMDFMAIMWNLHLSDPDEDERQAALKRAGDPLYDSLHKLQPLYSQIQAVCQVFYQPYKHVSIDERMVAFKGRISFKQYMKDKPTKWGYKLWVLADSRNGYTFRFDIYAGKRNTATNRGLTFDVIDNLMQPLLNQGYNMYCDNYYTSPELFNYLFDHGTPACGTVRENRKGYPKAAVNGLGKRDARGDYKWIRIERLLFVKWKDTRDVSVLSTIHNGNDHVNIQRNTKNADGEYVPLALVKPQSIAQYNTYMGGVDLSDQLISYYNVLLKSKKWYKTIFCHTVDLSIVNAFILYKEMCAGTGFEPMSQKEFRKQVAESLRKDWVDAEEARKVSHNPDVHAMFFCPVAINNPVETPASQKATAGRKNCARCFSLERKERKTPWKCSACSTPLCLQVDRNCFAMFHNLPTQ